MDNHDLKVLAIGDNQDNLISLKAVVLDRLPGSVVLTAQDGQLGVAMALAEDPDVILLDIVMPGMDGYAVCRALKEDERLQMIPVLFLTALRTDRESRVRALDVGAEGFLSKPFDEIELAAQIRAMAKIKAANRFQRLEKEELAALVAEKTMELQQELTARRQIEEELVLAGVRTKALLDLHELGAASQELFLDYVLEASLRMTQSEFTFIGLMDEAAEVMMIYRWSRDVMGQCALGSQPIHFPIAKAGWWGDCVRKRQPILVNDYPYNAT